jgi:phenylpropionate dioxygenase-like ring-hydroxylating dioxygenase large terminal subunit
MVSGWSYGMNGKLAKAPKYQDMTTFDKDANGLYPIHTHIDRLGFVWVNLEAKSRPTVPWNEDFAQIDQQPRLEAFDMTDYHFDHQWEMIGDYNWKTLADNYNEVRKSMRGYDQVKIDRLTRVIDQCYHCPTGHPAVLNYSDLSKYWVDAKGAYIQHFNTDKPGKKGMGIFSTFLYPNASITVS